MPTLRERLPKYRLHKASGQAIVTLGGHDHYLGCYGTEESKRAYQRKLAEWLASDKLAVAGPRHRTDFTIDEIFVRYWAHVETYYVRDGKPTGEKHALHSALKPLVNLYGPTYAADFGPLELKAVRESMIQQKLCRRLINQRINRIRRMFKWAIENSFVHPVVLQGLQAVSPLKRGRCEAHETEPVRPLPEEAFNATLLHMTSEVAAMAKLQWHTGMRPGEVVIMKGVNINRNGQTWEYKPEHHKTQYHGFERTIPLGPKAREILSQWIPEDPEECIFSPERKMKEWNELRKANRRSPMTPSQAARGPKSNPQKTPGLHYTTSSYGHAIAKACKKAGVPVWGPNRLRHTAATRLRKEYGIEAARVILGHRSIAVTEVYAEVDRSKAVQIMEKVG